MIEIPEGLEPLKALCEKHGIGFRYRKSGSLKPLKNREGGLVVFSTFAGASVVLKGTDNVSQEVFEKIVNLADPFCTRGWTNY